MPTAIIGTTTGKEVLSTGHCELFIFHVPLDRNIPERALSFAAKDADTGVRDLKNAEIFGAVVGVDPEIGGRWIRSKYQVPNGTILKVYLNRRPHSKLMVTCCQYIQVRDTAPYHKLRVKLLGGAKSKIQFADITGRFDILSLEEAKAAGVFVQPQFEPMFAKVRTNEVFTVEVLEAALTEKEEVVSREIETGEGKKITVRRRQRLRSMEV